MDDLGGVGVFDVIDDLVRHIVLKQTPFIAKCPKRKFNFGIVRIGGASIPT